MSNSNNEKENSDNPIIEDNTSESQLIENTENSRNVKNENILSESNIITDCNNPQKDKNISKISHNKDPSHLLSAACVLAHEISNKLILEDIKEAKKIAKTSETYDVFIVNNQGKINSYEINHFVDEYETNQIINSQVYGSTIKTPHEKKSSYQKKLVNIVNDIKNNPSVEIKKESQPTILEISHMGNEVMMICYCGNGIQSEKCICNFKKKTREDNLNHKDGVVNINMADISVDNNIPNNRELNKEDQDGDSDYMFSSCSTISDNESVDHESLKKKSSNQQKVTSSNEEITSSNEEVISSNEEVISSNEENNYVVSSHMKNKESVLHNEKMSPPLDEKKVIHYGNQIEGISFHFMTDSHEYKGDDSEFINMSTKEEVFHTQSSSVNHTEEKFESKKNSFNLNKKELKRMFKQEPNGEEMIKNVAIEPNETSELSIRTQSLEKALNLQDIVEQKVNNEEIKDNEVVTNFTKNNSRILKQEEIPFDDLPLIKTNIPESEVGNLPDKDFVQESQFVLHESKSASFSSVTLFKSDIQDIIVDPRDIIVEESSEVINLHDDLYTQIKERSNNTLVSQKSHNINLSTLSDEKEETQMEDVQSNNSNIDDNSIDNNKEKERVTFENEDTNYVEIEIHLSDKIEEETKKNYDISTNCSSTTNNTSSTITFIENDKGNYSQGLQNIRKNRVGSLIKFFEELEKKSKENKQ